MKRFVLAGVLFGALGLGATPPDSIPFVQYLGELQSAGTLTPFLQVLRAQVTTRLPDSTRAAVLAHLDRFEKGDFSGWERFLTLPEPVRLGALVAHSPLLVSAPSDGVPQIHKPVSGSLEKKWVRPCHPKYSAPSPISPYLPGLGYGHFPDRKLDACVFEDSAVVAEVLTALAAGNGSSIEYRGHPYVSAADFVEALLRSGHRISVKDDRMYADFLSMGRLDGSETYVRLPVWIQTGVKVKGEPVAVPVVHSQHTWIISGPDVNVRLAFFFGMDGVGFFPQRSRRPRWTGRGYAADRTAEGWDDNAEYVVATFEGATLYQRQIVRESQTVAKTMPAQGYGFLGVCNDSNAFLKKYTEDFFPVGANEYPFPLLRSGGLDRSPVTPLERRLAATPRDTVPMPHDDSLRCRLLGSYPHSLKGNGFDARLSRQMGELVRHLKRRGIDPRTCLLDVGI